MSHVQVALLTRSSTASCQPTECENSITPPQIPRVISPAIITAHKLHFHLGFFSFRFALLFCICALVRVRFFKHMRYHHILFYQIAYAPKKRGWCGVWHVLCRAEHNIRQQRQDTTTTRTHGKRTHAARLLRMHETSQRNRRTADTIPSPSAASTLPHCGQRHPPKVKSVSPACAAAAAAVVAMTECQTDGTKVAAVAHRK